MMKTRSKSLLLMIGILTVFILLPVIAFANAVPWSSTQYTASAGGGSSTIPDIIQSTSTPPVTATWNYPSRYTTNSISSITSNSMYVRSMNNMSSYDVLATADFSGTYISEAAPFLFTYNGTYASTSASCLFSECYRDHYAWLKITDLSASNNVLYNNSSLTLDGSTNIVEIPTLGGHEIKIDFGTKAYNYFESSSTGATDSVTLNYNMAVAPEPISSILFVTGGTLLAGRRYLRRKA